MLQKTLEIPKPEEVVRKRASKNEAEVDEIIATDQAEFNDVRKEKQNVSSAEEVGEKYEASSEPLSEASLKNSFKNFQTQQKGKISALASNALTNDFTLENERISFKLTNPLEVDAIESVKADLVVYLRNSFKNEDIQLTYEVSSANAVDRPYTPKEKFEAMMKKNPSLAKMKEIMGLDTDF